LDPKRSKFLFNSKDRQVAPEIAGNESNNGDVDKESNKQDQLDQPEKENGPLDADLNKTMVL